MGILLSKEQAIAEMRAGKKVRYHTWWWGRFIKFGKSNGHEVVLSDKRHVYAVAEIMTENKGWEIYDEAQHGAHNEQG